MNKLRFEMPTAWCRHHLVGEYVSTMVNNLLRVIEKEGIPVECIDYQNGNRFAIPDQETPLISYHSAGHARLVWHLKESAIPYFFSLDKGGYSGWSDFSKRHASDFDALTAVQVQVLERVRQDFRFKKISKYPQTVDAVRLPDAYYFFPLQLRDDTVARLSYLDYDEAIVSICEHAARQGKNLVIKRHPLCVDETVTELLAEIAENFPNVSFSIGNVHALIDGATAVVCCNSGVGFEALMLGKPVYGYGRSDYMAAVHVITELEGFEAVFSDPHGAGILQPEVLNAVIYHYLYDYCFDARDLAGIRQKLLTLTHSG